MVDRWLFRCNKSAREVYDSLLCTITVMEVVVARPAFIIIISQLLLVYAMELALIKAISLLSLL